MFQHFTGPWVTAYAWVALVLVTTLYFSVLLLVIQYCKKNRDKGLWKALPVILLGIGIEIWCIGYASSCIKFLMSSR